MCKFIPIFLVLALLFAGSTPAAAQSQDDVNSRMVSVLEQMDANLRAMQTQNRALQEEIRQLREELRRLQQENAELRARLTTLERRYGANGNVAAEFVVTPAITYSSSQSSRSSSANGYSGARYDAPYRPVSTSTYHVPAPKIEYKSNGCGCGCGCNSYFKKY